MLEQDHVGPRPCSSACQPGSTLTHDSMLSQKGITAILPCQSSSIALYEIIQLV